VRTREKGVAQCRSASFFLFFFSLCAENFLMTARCRRKAPFPFLSFPHSSCAFWNGRAITTNVFSLLSFPRSLQAIAADCHFIFFCFFFSPCFPPLLANLPCEAWRSGRRIFPFPFFFLPSVALTVCKKHLNGSKYFFFSPTLLLPVR